MLILRDPCHLPAVYSSTALAIGNFDGFHVGHQAVIRTMRERAKAKQLTPAALIFEPHPRTFFKKEAGPLRIEPFSMKAKRLRDAGVELLIIGRFNTALAGLSAEAFVNEMLVRHLRVGELVTGENFMFGKNRGGDSQFLKEQSRRGMFGYTPVPSVSVEGTPCSSTSLRQAIAKGDMRLGAILLGRPYETAGRVLRGDGRGRQLGAATANMKLTNIFKPRYGVYAVRFRQHHEKRWHEGVANFGIRPTFGGTEPVLEIHGFDVSGDLYGKFLSVQWMTFLREEIAFPSPEALKKQIAQDIAKAKQFFL